MAEARHLADFTDHPDMLEMRERYARILGGPQAVAVDGLVILAGLYTAISPWVVNGFTAAPRLTMNNVIVGLAVAVLGLTLTVAPARAFRLSWTLIPLGIWQIITPWVIGPHVGRYIWNNVWTGGVICALGLIAAGLLMSSAATGRGRGMGRMRRGRASTEVHGAHETTTR
jgi:hypothetical protein